MMIDFGGGTLAVLLMQAVQRLRNADGVTVLCCMQDDGATADVVG